MKTYIDNAKIVFLLKCGHRKVFCNMEHIPEAVAYFISHTEILEEQIKIYHFLFQTMAKASRPELNTMLVANKIDFRFSIPKELTEK